MPPDKINKSNSRISRKPRYFYGWNIVGATFLSHLVYAEHFTSILGFFFKPLQSEFGWKRSAIAGVQSVARVTEAVIAPLVGPVIDRHGPRVLMPLGAIIVGLAMLGVTQVSTLWQFYLLRGVVVAVGFTLMGNLVSGVAINNWFVLKRGRALAVSRLGNNISNVIFVPLTVFVIAASGWRTMFVIFAVVTWLVVLLPSVIFMRRRPEDMGLHPDGIEPGTTQIEGSLTTEENINQEDNSTLEPLWNRREVLKTGSFWMLTAALGINSMAFQGINISLAPYIQDLGYGETMLASVMTFRAIMAATSLPLMGFLSERANRTSVRMMPFLIQGFAVFILISAGNPVFLWLGVSLYGFGISGITIIQEVIWANYFGRLSLGTVRSMAFLGAFGLGAVGPIAMNIVFDIVGSYHPAFMVIIGLFALSAFVMVIVKPPRAKRFATVTDLTAST